MRFKKEAIVMAAILLVPLIILLLGIFLQRLF